MMNATTRQVLQGRIVISAICCVLIGYFICSNFLAIQHFYTNSFVSDYIAVLSRYSLYKEQGFSLWNFFSSKQANHNHFLVFF